MNEYEIKEMEELTDDAKTIAEHSRLILTYRQTGFLNREEAIRKYKVESSADVHWREKLTGGAESCLNKNLN